MKKSIIYLSFALVAFTGAAVANTQHVAKFGLVKEYRNATPLAVAIMKGDLESVKKFIEYGADVNERSNGMTPLMIAARYNRADMITLLLNNGAKLKDKDERGYTAIKYAQFSNAQEAVDVLTKAMEA